MQYELTARLVYTLDLFFSVALLYIHTSFPRVDRDQRSNPEEQNTLKTKSILAHCYYLLHLKSKPFQHMA